MYTGFYNSPIGIIKISHSGIGVSSLIFIDENPKSIDIPDILNPVVSQLEEYFAGNRKIFNLQFDMSGTEFQKQVWNLLLEIPFGKTLSYLDISKQLDDPNKIRAVGNANGKNPVSIIVPCHRVIGSDGSLTGYAGGLWRKEWLLNHEKKFKQLSLF